jgi:glycosyltransferase involved in cell wall biosynthesis
MLVIIYVVNVDWFFISHRLDLAKVALDKNYKVYLLAKDTGKFDFIRELGINCINIDFERSNINIFREIKIINILRKYYVKLKPNIIHHVTLKPMLYGSIASKYINSSTKIVNAVSGLGYSFINTHINFKTIFLKKLMKFAFNSNNIFFIFQNIDDYNYYNKLKLVKPNNFIIIKGSGVDQFKFKQKIYKSNNSNINIVMVCRMLKDKGVIEFINAALLLKEKYKDLLKFKLVGDIDSENPSSLTKEELFFLTDGEYISWEGFKADVFDIYTKSDIVCLPSYREGLPKSLIEAMSVGCPIITTEAAGTRECVINGWNGFLVPVKDSILLSEYIELLSLNKDLRIEMGKNSRIKMEKEFSLKYVIETTHKFYYKILN